MKSLRTMLDADMDMDIIKAFPSQVSSLLIKGKWQEK